MAKTTTLNTFNVILIKSNAQLNNSFIDHVKPISSIIQYSSISGAVKLINEKARIASHGNIKALISNITPNVDIMLISCINFRSEWKEKFSRSNTKKGQFYPSKRIEYMMHLENTMSNYYEDDNYQLLEKDLIDPDMCVGFVLSKSRNLNKLISDPEQLENMSLNTKLEKIRELQIPKFVQRSDFELLNLFRKRGLLP
jgi:serine protease inhibitor